MALDGQVLAVADTPDNARYFGRASTDRGSGAYPQVRAVYLCECGVHTIVDAGFWPYATSERIGGHRLLRSVGPGFLVMADAGFYSYAWINAVRKRGAHALVRLPNTVTFDQIETLTDGSVLIRVRQRNHNGQLTGESCLLRLIQYHIDDPASPGYGQKYRLVTTILDPDDAPAHDLAVAYHERWEIELVADEIETHQHPDGPTLRSKTPVGVLQELYGMLLAHHVTRVVMFDAAQRHGIDTDRLSFVHSLRLIRETVPYFQMAGTKKKAEIYENLLDQIVRYQMQPRQLRTNARVVKRKMSNFPLKRTEHRTVQQPTKPYKDAIVLI
jgi:hypothetical protein